MGRGHGHGISPQAVPVLEPSESRLAGGCFMAMVSASFVSLFLLFLNKKANPKILWHCLEKNAITKQCPSSPLSGTWSEECREKHGLFPGPITAGILVLPWCPLHGRVRAHRASRGTFQQSHQLCYSLPSNVLLSITAAAPDFVHISWGHTSPKDQFSKSSNFELALNRS